VGVSSAIWDRPGRLGPVEWERVRLHSYDLTDREVEVLRVLARGLSNRAIAEELVLSSRTVQHHLASVYDKIDLRTRAGAAVFAIENGLVPATADI
jgi:DNA-binding NarL/FixJ family response regulator